MNNFPASITTGAAWRIFELRDDKLTDAFFETANWEMLEDVFIMLFEKLRFDQTENKDRSQSYHIFNYMIFTT